MERALTEDIDLAPFFTAVAGARHPVLMIDYDGCLAPFRAERHRAIPYPGVRERLRSVQTDRRTRLVIVSGRRARELPPLLGLSPMPEIWGSNGLERSFADGSRDALRIEPSDLRALERAEREARRRGLGGLLERKNGSLALHWRALDEETTCAVDREARRIWEWAPDMGLELCSFDGGLELRLPGASKRHAVVTIRSEEGPASPIAYLGSDRTDEEAFEALPADGLSVLVRDEPRPTRAQLWVRPPEGLVALLDRWIEARDVRPAATPGTAEP